MESGIDFTKHTEAELVEMFGRLDPRFAPAECARLGTLLTERGYIVTQGDTGPGSVAPSASKLQALIGTSRPFECDVNFGRVGGPFSYLEPTHNDLGLVGSGKAQVDGISLYLTGRATTGRGIIPPASTRQVQIPIQHIVNVESQGRLVRLEYRGGELDDGAITLQLPDDTAAAALVAVLPKGRTKDFSPQIKANAEFEASLIARSPKTPVTVGLVTINTLVFIAMLLSGAEWFHPSGNTLIAWGSNFGPYTTDGEWWRLLTSLFIQFGLAHIFFNMLALASFGPLVERLYGGMTYLLIYLLTGIFAGLASIAWHPAANSAGASGAILGILGALLAAQLRAGNHFPLDILRPIRYSTLVFLGWTLYAGLTHKGVDNAAHLGGLASGFVVGLASAPPIRGERVRARRDLFRLLPLVPVAAALLAGGFWWAQRAAASLDRDGLYYRTLHWIGVREHTVNSELNSALRLERKNPAALIETLERSVIPFWREAGDRLSVIQLLSDSPNVAALDALQNLSYRRAQVYQLLDEGLRSNDPKVIAAAGAELKQIDQIAKRRS